MLEKLDRGVLHLANDLVEKFNWLTGKDNVFLAHIFNFLAAVVGVFLTREMPGAVNYFVIALFFALFAGLIFITGHIFDQDLKGRRARDLSDRMRSARLMTICLFIFSTIVFLAFKNLIPDQMSELFPTYTFLLCVVIYIISVPRPPFQESKVTEELEEMLPHESPEPARVRSRK